MSFELVYVPLWVTKISCFWLFEIHGCLAIVESILKGFVVLNYVYRLQRFFLSSKCLEDFFWSAVRVLF